jgi:NitT/TauT family transport system ATP-binding protein
MTFSAARRPPALDSSEKANGPVDIEISRLSYRYPSGTLALEDFSLEVRRGEMMAVVGPSGCGKSTLLQLIAGFASPTAGAISQADSESGRHQLAMVFQKDTVMPWLTVEKNVSLYYRFRKGSAGAREKNEHINHLLEMAGLADFRKAYPYQLSGGMRRRVAFLTSVAARPAILLLDEPFSGLDEPTKINIHQSIFSIIRELGITGILVTHDLQEAISLCDEVAILTKRPARVAHRERIPFGSDRKMLALRGEPDFLELYGMLWTKLSAEILGDDTRSEDE